MNRFTKAIAALMLMTAVVFTAKSMNAQTYKGHDYVDLGLPSGTLWATCNVGANTPEGYGDYFAWGETQPKTNYDWSTYKYANGPWDKLTKYCNRPDLGNNGFTDNLTTLQAGDDAATANWGSDWCMPTKDQWTELNVCTTSIWTTRNGVVGREFTSLRNGKTLFLPAAGYHHWDLLKKVGSWVGYWSSSLGMEYPGSYEYPRWAWSFEFGSSKCSVKGTYRTNGFTVRPVRSARQN